MNRHNRVVLVVPDGIATCVALKWAESKRPWIERQMRHMPELVRLSAWLQRHPTISLSGCRVAVCIHTACEPLLRPAYELLASGLHIYFGEASFTDLSEAALHRLLRQLAKIQLTERVLQLAAERALCVQKIRVGDQATRWGSCSSRGTISLNWRLLLIAPRLQDAIILHELAHLIELNHSPSFWGLLATYDPMYQQNLAELNRISDQIMRIGRHI